MDLDCYPSPQPSGSSAEQVDTTATPAPLDQINKRPLQKKTTQSQSQTSTRTQSPKDISKDPTHHSVLGKRYRGESEIEDSEKEDSEEEEFFEVEMISDHKWKGDSGVSKNDFNF